MSASRVAVRQETTSLPDVCFFAPKPGDTKLRYKFLEIVHEFEFELVHPDILLCRNALPFLGNLVAFAEGRDDHDWVASTVTDGKTTAVSVRQRTSRMLPVAAHLGSELGRYHDLLAEISGLFIAAYRVFVNRHLKVRGGQGFELTRYDVGEFFREHIDRVHGASGESARVLSTVCFWVTPDLEGGELIFPRQGVQITPRCGDMVVFPSDFTFPHEAAKVTRGTKHSLVTWFV